MGCPPGARAPGQPLGSVPSLASPGLGHGRWRTSSAAQCCPLLAAIVLFHQLDSKGLREGAPKGLRPCWEESHEKVQGLWMGGPEHLDTGHRTWGEDPPITQTSVADCVRLGPGGRAEECGEGRIRGLSPHQWGPWVRGPLPTAQPEWSL